MTEQRKPPCAGLTHMFYPDPGERPERLAERLEACRKLCHNCEYIITCSIRAFTNRESGIWAGRLHPGADQANPALRRRKKKP